MNTLVRAILNKNIFLIYYFNQLRSLWREVAGACDRYYIHSSFEGGKYRMFREAAVHRAGMFIVYLTIMMRFAGFVAYEMCCAISNTKYIFLIHYRFIIVNQILIVASCDKILARNGGFSAKTTYVLTKVYKFDVSIRLSLIHDIISTYLFI